MRGAGSVGNPPGNLDNCSDLCQSALGADRPTSLLGILNTTNDCNFATCLLCLTPPRLALMFVSRKCWCVLCQTGDCTMRVWVDIGDTEADLINNAAL
jgi:hypothetical protein